MSIDTPAFLAATDALCKRVFFHFFSCFPSHMSDLLSEGKLKVVSLIRSGRYHPDQGLLYNFLFTGVRNSMTNYISKIRENPSQEEIDWDMIPDLSPAGHFLDIAEIQKMFKSPVEFAGYVLGVMEGRIMMDLWRDCTEQDKELFALLLDFHTRIKCVRDLREKCGDLILWCLFVFAGETVKFPTSVVLSRLLRQAQVYNLREGGMSEEEVGRKVGLRRVHIKRIYNDIKEIKKNAAESIGTDIGTGATADYSNREGFGIFG